MSLTINIDGITVFAKHGVYDEEKNNNQKFLIDLNVELKEETINLTNYEPVSYTHLTLPTNSLV